MRHRSNNPSFNSAGKKSSASKSGSFSKRSKVSGTSGERSKTDGRRSGPSKNFSKRQDNQGEKKGGFPQKRRSDGDGKNRSFSKPTGKPNNQKKNDRRGEAPQKGKSKVGAKPREMVPSAWSAKGEAICNSPDGKRILVWSGIPFEKATVQITHAGQHQSFGYVKSVDTPSPHRIDPKCKRYDRCGGCPLMHLSDDGQDEAKLQLFARTMTEVESERMDALSAEGTEYEGPFFDAVDWPTTLTRVGTDNGYRMVSKLVAGKASHGALRLGARNRNGDIVPIPDCVVTDSELNTVGKRIAHLLEVLKIFPYTPSNRSGMRYVVLRKARPQKKYWLL